MHGVSLAPGLEIRSQRGILRRGLQQQKPIQGGIHDRVGMHEALLVVVASWFIAFHSDEPDPA